MQNTDQNESNIISLFDAKKRAKNKEETSSEEKSVDDFLEIMKKNAENKARMQKERNKSNKGVIRSHRLKR